MTQLHRSDATLGYDAVLVSCNLGVLGELVQPGLVLFEITHESVRWVEMELGRTAGGLAVIDGIPAGTRVVTKGGMFRQTPAPRHRRAHSDSGLAAG